MTHLKKWSIGFYYVVEIFPVDSFIYLFIFLQLRNLKKWAAPTTISGNTTDDFQLRGQVILHSAIVSLFYTCKYMQSRYV